MRRFVLTGVGLLAATALSGSGAWEEARARILAHPRLQAARVAARDAQADTALAATPWRPHLEIELENVPATGSPSGLGRAGLSVWTGLQRPLGEDARWRRAVARAAADQVGLDTLVVRRDLLREAANLHETWLRERWRQDLLDTLAAKARRNLEHQRTLRATGRAGGEDEALAEAELLRWTREAEAARRGAALSWKELESLCGPLPAPTETPPAGPLETRAGGTDLDSLRLRREAEVERGLALRARSEAAGEVAGSVGVLTEADGSVGLGARVSFPLPPWNRPVWEASRGEARGRALAREAELGAARRRDRLRALDERIAAAREDWESWRDAVPPALERGSEALERKVAQGAAGTPSLWAVRRELSQARLEALGKLGRLRDLQRERMDAEGVEP